MRVDELTIPHPDGAVHVRLHERLTVVAGLAPPARARFARLLVDALAGIGPAQARIRDDLGATRVCGVGAAAPGLDGATLARVVVGPAGLGLAAATTDPVVQAERTATAMAQRELVRELAALEAGAAERSRLEDEAESVAARRPVPDAPVAAVPSAGTGPDLDAVARAGPTIDELLRRRQLADDVLRHTGAILRSFADGTETADGSGRSAPPPPAAGEPAPPGHPLGEGLRAAVAALRRLEEGTARVTTVDRAQAARDARAAVRRALEELERARAGASVEIATCDEALGAIAATAGVPVGPGGPGAALTAAVAARRTRRPRPDEDPAARLLARRLAALEARIHELPEEDEVLVARRRLDAVTTRLAALDATGLPDVARARAALLGRFASVRTGLAAGVPLVLDDPFVAVPVDERCDLLDLLARIAERSQVVLLSGDPAVATWARHHRAELRLIDLARACEVA